MTAANARVTSYFFILIGVLFLMVPLVFRWYVSDYDRYLNMIRGPYPFDHWGSSPRQLFSLGTGPIFLGGASLSLSLWFREKFKYLQGSDQTTPSRTLFAIAIIAAIIGGLMLTGAFFP